eukprot:COSAG02_NODE_2763_length_8071_cov_26.991846_2_plen_111_part_00
MSVQNERLLDELGHVRLQNVCIALLMPRHIRPAQIVDHREDYVRALLHWRCCGIEKCGERDEQVDGHTAVQRRAPRSARGRRPRGVPRRASTLMHAAPCTRDSHIAATTL